MLEVETTDVLWYVDHVLDAMAAILARLGDRLANERPDLPGANSPFAIVTHCLGVMEFWAGAMIADRPIVRDRDAEFTATGAVDDLVARVALCRRRFAADLDKRTRATLDRGRRMTELLKQPQYEPASIARQVMAIFAGTKGYLDDIPIERVVDFERSLLRFLEQNHPELEEAIVKDSAVSPELEARLRAAIEDFKKGYA